MSELERRLCGSEPYKGANRDVRVAQIAARQHGLVNARQLLACGLDRNAIAVRVRRGHLYRKHRGVYAVGHPTLTQTGTFIAAVLACGAGAVLCRYAAAAHLGLLAYDDGRDPEVIVPRSGGRKIEGIDVHRSRLDPRDVWTRDGIRVTAPARTMLDLAATMGPNTLRRLARQAQAEHRVNVRQLLEILQRHPGHRGAAKLRAAIADGPAPTRSDHEDLVLALIDRAGIDRPELNVWPHLDGRSISPDMLWRNERVVVECDSRRWHSDPLTLQDDADKQAILEAHDYRVLRVTWRQAVNRPQQTADRFRNALSGARSGS